MAPGYLADNLVFLSALHDYNMRNDLLLMLPRCCTNFNKHAFCYRAPEAWNKLPKYVQEAVTLYSFKTSLKHYISGNM